MKAEDFFETQKPNMRELWHIGKAREEMICLLMERYAALRQNNVNGRSEQYCHPYFLVHKGIYVGGVIIVVEENLQRAKERIEKELVSAGVSYADFDLEQVTPIDLKSPSTVYLDSGDY